MHSGPSADDLPYLHVLLPHDQRWWLGWFHFHGLRGEVHWILAVIYNSYPAVFVVSSGLVPLSTQVPYHTPYGIRCCKSF